ncbi:MAG TPA: DUF885 domain-containing protein, partial [Duganella sp.]|nr:DUF885 domain-containing protein [Duganella sp.]
MKRVFKWLAITLASVVLVIAALVVHTIYFKPLSLDWFYTRVFAAFALDSPEMLSTLRILPGWADFYSAKLDDASPAHEKKALDLVKNSLATLRQYDREKLDHEGQLSYDALAYYLQIQADGEPYQHHD